MSRLSKSELEQYDIEELQNICISSKMKINESNNKSFLIKIILWKDKQTEKFTLGKYKETKKEPQPYVSVECQLFNSDDENDNYMPGDEMKNMRV